ncbi:hypothetical protein [Nocardia concava]|uniref:hypothetical protein n=1 Tax=Nocardia concava TaxID=257281 RepID=UPI0002F5B87B|nr:hypothetical protein [Nocardia concava]
MKSIRRYGLGAAGIAAISTAVALTAPLATADTVGQGDSVEFITYNDCPPSPTPTPTKPSGTGSSLTPLTGIIDSILKGLGGAGGATSSGSASSVG